MAEDLDVLTDTKPLDALVQQAMPNYGVDVPKVKASLTDIARRESEWMTAARDKEIGSIERDKAEVRSKYEGIKPLEATPWNSEAEREKHRTGPVESFGSLGSAFAMIASAFTRQPMINGLNGAAAAMEAIKKNDDQAYDRDYTAWKDNTNLAIKNHEIQRSAYGDAVNLMKTNQEAGVAELKMLAARFGDERMLALADGGYFKEIIDMENARANQARAMIPVMAQVDKMHMQKQLLKLDPDAQSGDPARVRMAINRAANGDLTPEQDIYQRTLAAEPDASPQRRREILHDIRTDMAATSPEARAHLDWRRKNPELIGTDAEAEFLRSTKRADRPLSPVQMAVESFIETYGQGDKKNVPPELLQEFINGFNRGKVGLENKGNVQAKAAHELVKEAEARGEKLLLVDALKRVEQTTKGPSGNRIDQLRDRYDKMGEAMTKIDAVTDVLEHHALSAGVGGRATRVLERVNNIFGGNETDRVQYMRDVQFLRESLPRLLNDSSGRPLASEVSKINDIVAGLDTGDTTANTLRAYDELKKLMTTMRRTVLSRISGEWTPDGKPAPGAPAPATGGAPPPTGGSRPKWDIAPLKKE